MTDPTALEELDLAARAIERARALLSGEAPPPSDIRDGYSADQQRVADYIVKLTGIGGGDDPIGFLIASHAVLSRDGKLREALQTIADGKVPKMDEWAGYIRSTELFAQTVLKPWLRCPSTHCERRGECAGPSDCIVKSLPKGALSSSPADIRDGKLKDALEQCVECLRDCADDFRERGKTRLADDITHIANYGNAALSSSVRDEPGEEKP